MSSAENRLDYRDLINEIEKPYKHRGEVEIGRGGTVVKPRKHHVTSEQKASIILKCNTLGMVTVNPFVGREGLYWAQIEALIRLGPDIWHAIKPILEKIEEIMRLIKVGSQTAWDKACERRNKNSSNRPKTIEGKIVTNYEVLQRLPVEGKKERNPYGSKLAQFGMCVDIEWRKSELMVDLPVEDIEIIPHFRLNTKNWGEWNYLDGPCKIKPIRNNPYVKRGRRKKNTNSSV